MKKLICIIRLSQGLVLVAFISFTVLGASVLDSKETIILGEYFTFFFTLVWMALLMYLFEAVGKLIIKKWKLEDLVDQQSATKNERMFCNVQISNRGRYHE